MKCSSLLLFILLFGCGTYAQNGSFTATATIDGKPVTFRIAKPFFKFNNPHGYWFVNPHTGERHLNMQPDQGYGNADILFVDFDGEQNDVDLYYAPNHDTSSFSMANKDYSLEVPEAARDNSVKPLHIHFTKFTISEVEFSISGTMRYILIKSGKAWANCSVSGSGHFYREANYDHSDPLPGCNCDPTIYATVYDEENNVRTTSACENALYNKLFDAVQKSMVPLFINVSYHGSQSPMPAGAIDISMIAGHVNINVPVRDRPYCSSDYFHNRLTGVDAHKKLFTNDDSYGLRFIKMPSAEVLNVTSSFDVVGNAKMQMAFLDSLNKLLTAKKISQEQMMKAFQIFQRRTTR